MVEDLIAAAINDARNKADVAAAEAMRGVTGGLERRRIQDTVWMRRPAAWWLVPLLLAAAPAESQTLRDLCADRPGLGTPPCILDAGHFQLELGLADWTHDRVGLARTDDWLLGDFLVRYGLDDRTELQLGATLFGEERVRDGPGQNVARSTGTGDIGIALRRSLLHPDGAGASVAVQPFLTLPTGGQVFGAGEVSAGLLVPVSADLGAGLTLGLTPEIDAAADVDRHGHHLAFGGVAGLDLALGAVDLTVEAAAMRDDDPLQHVTQSQAGLSVAWQAARSLQLDVGANVGLNRRTPDTEFYVGIARRF